MTITNGTRLFKNAVLGLFAVAALCATGACSSLQVAGNESGSEPINAEEQKEYMKAIRRCHKMGGSRIVKFQGELRCF
jgi:hypothetical protein